ncbi:MAG: DNA-processing protein DprA [Thermoanaerobaculia bacterium]|nr:DNA-processing protein DprA [Thermoanaerobaculia bacterium]
MDRTPTDRQLLVALSVAPELSRAAACALGATLGSWRDAGPAAAAALARELGVPARQLALARELVPRAAALAAAADARAAELGARLVALAEEGYPPPLLDLRLPPPALHVAGELRAGPAVAIVGSRRATPYALEIATWLGRELAAAGLVVVSGFARGVDAAAHAAALAAPAGRTVAVLGCGLAVDYPRGQRDLALRVAAGGALVSEFPPEAPPEAWRFPVRNRIIAALSRGVVVVSAAPRSGSLVTARLALELGRDVLAVPGRILDENSLGAHELLRDGAALVRHPADVLEALGLESPGAGVAPLPRDTGPAPSAPADPLLDLLAAGGPLAPEAIAAALDTPVERLLGRLLELELAGRLRRLPGPLFAVVR